MEQDFWNERWENGQIGFHQSKVNPMLQTHVPELINPGDRVLVPLCGKSLDLLFLAELASGPGAKVQGVEFIEQAVHEFFHENRIEYRDAGAGRFVSEKIELFCRDFLGSSPAQLAGIGPANFIYDRAALVALPAEMRPAYAQNVTRLAARGAVMFLVTFEYDQHKVPGPPFSISPETVAELYAPHFTIEEQERKAAPPRNPRFVEGGVESVAEVAYVLRRKS